VSGVIELLQEIVRIPSVSGDEAACRDHLVSWLRAQGVDARASGRNVIAVVEGRPAADPAHGLLLLTHIDVVPVGAGWTREPWDGALENGKVFGRGSNDAKSSAAAMAWVAAHLDPASIEGRLVVVLACDEETGGEGIEACAAELPLYDAAVVGEPTGLSVCPGQRGLFRATLEAVGRACHASRPWEGVNAVDLAARDVLAVHGLDLGDADPLLGPATLQATVIQGGTKPNVLPGACSIELDGRPTPTCDNARMESLLRAAVQSTVHIRSNRFLPVRVDPDAPIVVTARAASPRGELGRFGGVSDLFHVRHVPGVVMGPGTSEASHAPDEWVTVSQVEAAVAAYDKITRTWLQGATLAS
jgi:acetylornithine deacetylase